MKIVEYLGWAYNLDAYRRFAKNDRNNVYRIELHAGPMTFTSHHDGDVFEFLSKEERDAFYDKEILGL